MDQFHELEAFVPHKVSNTNRSHTFHEAHITARENYKGFTNISMNILHHKNMVYIRELMYEGLKMYEHFMKSAPGQ